jgi:hypothetical protein
VKWKHLALLALSLMVIGATTASPAGAMSAPPGSFIRWQITLHAAHVKWGFAARIVRKSRYLALQTTGTTPFTWRRIDAPLPWQPASGTPDGRYVPTWLFKKRDADATEMTRVFYVRLKVRRSARYLEDGTRLCFRLRHDVDRADIDTASYYRFCVTKA